RPGAAVDHQPVGHRTHPLRQDRRRRRPNVFHPAIVPRGRLPSMPVSKKRKPEKKKRHDHEPSGEIAPGAGSPAEPSGAGGFLSRMRGGLQNVTGTGPKKKESLLSKVITWALVAVAAWFVAKRFGILR